MAITRLAVIELPDHNGIHHNWFIDSKLCQIRRCDNPHVWVDFESDSQLCVFMLSCFANKYNYLEAKEMLTAKDAEDYDKLIRGKYKWQSM